MKNKGLNKLLLKKREELHLTLKEASSLIGISHLKLSLYEKGYYPVSKTNQEKIISAYHLESDFFSNDLGYPVVVAQTKEQKKAVNTIIKIISSVWTKIAAGFLMVVSLVLIPYGSIKMNLPYVNPERFYSSEFLKLRGYVEMNPTSTSIDPLLLDIKDTYANHEDNTETPYLSFFTYTNPQNYRYSGFKSVIVNDNYAYYFTISATDDYMAYDFSVFDATDSEHQIYHGDGKRYKQGEIEFKALAVFNEEGEPEEITNKDPRYQEANILINNASVVSEKEFDAFLANPETFNYDKGFDSVITDLINTKNALLDCENSGLLLMIFSCIFALSFLCLLIFSFILSLRKTSYNKIEKRDDIDESDPKILSYNKELTPLKKNWKIFPLIPEFIIRIAGLILLLLSSLGVFLLFGTFFGLFPDWDLGEVNSFYQASSSFVIIAVIILLITKLNKMQNSQTIFVTVLMFFVGGIFYYIAETLIIYDLTLSATVPAILVDSYASFLPGNILWGIGTFSCFSLFLFTTPKKIADKTPLLVLWRLCALIPIAYLAGSELYAVGVKLSYWSRLPYAASFLLYPRAFIMTCFAIFYSLGVYIYRLIIKHKYGKKNAELFFNGYKSAFICNIMASIIVIVLAIVDYCVGTFDPTNPLKLGGSYLIIFLVPFILLYHPPIGKRNIIWDFSFNILYGICYGISYFLIAFVIIL